MLQVINFSSKFQFIKFFSGGQNSNGRNGTFTFSLLRFAQSKIEKVAKKQQNKTNEILLIFHQVHLIVTLIHLVFRNIVWHDFTYILLSLMTDEL